MRTLKRTRRGPGKRVDPDVKDREAGRLTDAQLEFVAAMARYKKLNRVIFPAWSEALDVLIALGYRKVQPRAFPLDAPEAPIADRMASAPACVTILPECTATAAPRSSRYTPPPDDGRE